ncbi:MAG: 2-polyprenyl-6-methoxyphenol hydroxylase-like FAD-dependent oxidoreductase [Polyangiales bacterium]|jgi:2-polyprenyl-6-methoxyphenol hydroxylase-like FAD-dependent oxidoreductase
MVWNIGIVGAGFAGAATALFLRERGHAVTVYEAVAEPQPVGAGILLQPTGQDVLRRLGLYEEVEARGAVVDELSCATGERLVFRLKYADGGSPAGLGLHRGVLFGVLYDALRPAGVHVELGVEVADVRQGCVYDVSDKKCGQHDLVIVADGARSMVRERTFGHLRDAPYPFGALWFVAEDPQRRFQGKLHQQLRGADEMVGFMATGLGPSGDVPLVSFFYSVASSRVDAVRAAGLDAFKAKVLEVAPQAGPVLDQIHSMDSLLFAGYRDVVLTRPYRNRTVFIGDAGHAMSPQLGQGSNLALIDAEELARHIGEHADLAHALDAFWRSRRGHQRLYQFASRWLTPFFQSNAGSLGRLRDLTFPIAIRFSPLRRRMIRVLSGREAGVFRRPYRFRSD